MSDAKFLGADGKLHHPSDHDYWQATVRELQRAIIDLQYRVASLDQGEAHWPADTHEPPYELPRRTGRDGCS